VPSSEPVRKAVSELSPENIEVVVDRSLDHFMIHSDNMIWKVFYNLIHNTLRHAEGATVIKVGLEEREDRLHLIYEDDGPGIPEETRRSIFEYGSGDGKGYGLYLVRELPSVNHMEIWEEGEGGARFVIDIPPSQYARD